MTPDLSFVAGLLLAGLAVLNVLARFAEGRFTWPAPALALLAAGLIGWAELKSPSGYSVAGIPEAVVRVVGDILN